MGGYGAAKLALKYPERFKSGHSHSGAVLFGHLSFEENHLRRELGPSVEAEFRRILGNDPPKGANDLCFAAENLDPSYRPSLRVDCGTDDFLLQDNRQFHEFLGSIGFEHEYEEFPGAHEWSYWDRHVQEAIAFHRKNLGF
jgi:S-formylglutathione hydrolase FrmB